MRIDSNHPAISALKKEAQEKLGHPLRTPRDFLELSTVIEDEMKRPLSEQTLQRLWNYRRTYKTVSVYTLDVLCRYTGHDCWEQFLLHLNQASGRESGFITTSAIRIDQLKPGQLLRIGWMPDRLCLLRYLGQFRFTVIESRNARLQTGDIFTCMQIQSGQPMFISHLVRDEKDWEYVVGNRSGLTLAELVD